MTAIYRSYIGLLAQELVSGLQTSKHRYSQIFAQKDIHMFASKKEVQCQV